MSDVYTKRLPYEQIKIEVLSLRHKIYTMMTKNDRCQ